MVIANEVAKLLMMLRIKVIDPITEIGGAERGFPNVCSDQLCAVGFGSFVREFRGRRIAIHEVRFGLIPDCLYPTCDQNRDPCSEW